MHTFVNPDPDLSDDFGGQIAVVGDLIAIGAHADDAGAVDAGTVYSIRRDRPYELVRTIHNPTPEDDELFGSRWAQWATGYW